MTKNVLNCNGGPSRLRKLPDDSPIVTQRSIPTPLGVLQIRSTRLTVLLHVPSHVHDNCWHFVRVLIMGVKLHNVRECDRLGKMLVIDNRRNVYTRRNESGEIKIEKERWKNGSAWNAERIDGMKTE